MAELTANKDASQVLKTRPNQVKSADERAKLERILVNGQMKSKAADIDFDVVYSVSKSLKDNELTIENIIDRLILALDNSNRQEKIGIIETLGLIGDKKAVVPLTLLIADSDYGDVAIEALYSIGALDKDQLIKLFESEHAKVKIEVENLLNRIESTREIGVLLQAINDESPDARQLAYKKLLERKNIDMGNLLFVISDFENLVYKIVGLAHNSNNDEWDINNLQ